MFLPIKPTLAFLFIITITIIVPLMANASDADSDHLDDSIASTPGSWFNGLAQGQDAGSSEVSTDASEIDVGDEGDTESSDMSDLEDGEAENGTSSHPWYDPFGLMEGQGQESTPSSRVVRSADDSEATIASSSNETEAVGTDDVIDDNSTIQANNTNGNETDAFNFASTAATSTFSCDHRKFGYYADVGRNCTIYHLCNPVTLPDNPELVYQRISFLCLQNSTFDQLTLSCTKHPQISCEISPSYYDSSNLAIRRSASDFHENQVDDSDDDEDETSTDSDEDEDEDESATPTSRPSLMSMLFPRHRR